jgi:ABC-2 type transport system permease protein
MRRPLWILLRHELGQLLGGRRLIIVSLGVAAALLPAALLASPSDPAGFSLELTRQLLVPVLLPVVTLVFAVAAAGTEVRDGTMVNLVTKPYPRELVLAAAYLAAVLATCAVLVPAEILAHVGVARGAGDLSVLGGTVLAIVMGALAYGALGLLLGLVTGRALLVGLAYALIWEGAIASVSPSAAAASVRGWVEGILSTAVAPAGLDFTTRLGPVTSVVCILVLAAAAFVLASRRLRSADLG